MMLFPLIKKRKAVLNVAYAGVVLALFLVAVYFTIALFKQQESTERTIGRQDAVIDQMTDANGELAKTVDQQVRSIEATGLVVDENQKNKYQSSLFQSGNFAKAEKKVGAIELNYNNKIGKASNPEKISKLVKEKERRISEARIDALWTNYCKFEQGDTDCKE